MVVHNWDEISEEWTTHELAVESRDPVEINKALGRSLIGPEADSVEDESPDGWKVESSSWAGPVLTIETRSDLGHLAVIVVMFIS